ncbi:hypothetical protein CLIB1423_15S02036 [[Candida] railenensis]|uniref:Peptidase A1 domain-containing protein n=1 Tax=[Candida] railenensis TaxID=45579 RepID=A0A9P0VZS9_9ASCO|nr:hypothetical protein CLIB1423_15S02036 [[Candida] railenensis]
MKLYAIPFIVSYVAAILPVKDFRVSDMGSNVVQKQAVLATASSSALSLSLSLSSSSSSLHSVSAPGSSNSSASTTVSSSATSSLESAASSATSSLASAASSATSSSLPIVQLTDTSFYIVTDSSRAVYYLDTNIYDAASSYNSTFPLLIDTGSSMSWIYNESCSSGPCTDAAKFDDDGVPRYSSTKFNLAYSGDVVSGDLVTTNGSDLTLSVRSPTMSIGLQNITIGLANTSPSIFDGYNISGVIGIPATFTLDHKNVIQQLYTQGVIDKKIVSVIINTNNSATSYMGSTAAEVTSSSYGGVLFLGSVSNPFASPENTVVYADVVPNSNAYWLMNATEIEIQSQNGTTEYLNYTNSGNDRQAIIDTGTTGIVMPMADANLVHEQLFGSDLVTDGLGNYAFKCSSQSAEISFTTSGGETLTILSSYFTGNAYTSSALTGYCASKIQGTTTNDFWILGAAFLSQYFTTFDLETAQLGFTVASDTSYILKNATSSNGTASYSATTLLSVSSTKTATSSGSTTSGKNGATSSHRINISSFFKGLFLIFFMI